MKKLSCAEQLDRLYVATREPSNLHLGSLPTFTFMKNMIYLNLIRVEF